jgi:hypothetical protein
MPTHDAKHFRQRRRAQGVPARDPFSATRFQQRASEPRRLAQLPWPRKPFGEVASVADLIGEPAHGGENATGGCLCIPPFNAVCPSSGGSRGDEGPHDISAREDTDGRRPRPASQGRQQRKRLTPRHSELNRGEEEYDGCIHHGDRDCFWIVGHLGGSGDPRGLKSAFNPTLREMRCAWSRTCRTALAGR